jgi:hypothetical protein
MIKIFGTILVEIIILEIPHEHSRGVAIRSSNAMAPASGSK